MHQKPFRTGEQVICIDDHIDDPMGIIPNKPVKDKQYTIRDCFWRPSMQAWCCLLSELSNPPVPLEHDRNMTFEPAFKSTRFRPVQDYDPLAQDESMDEELVSVDAYEMMA